MAYDIPKKNTVVFLQALTQVKCTKSKKAKAVETVPTLRNLLTMTAGLQYQDDPDPGCLLVDIAHWQYSYEMLWDVIGIYIYMSIVYFVILKNWSYEATCYLGGPAFFYAFHEWFPTFFLGSSLRPLIFPWLTRDRGDHWQFWDRLIKSEPLGGFHSHGGTPESSSWIGISLTKTIHFWGNPIYGNPQVMLLDNWRIASCAFDVQSPACRTALPIVLPWSRFARAKFAHWRPCVKHWRNNHCKMNQVGIPSGKLI